MPAPSASIANAAPTLLPCWNMLPTVPIAAIGEA